MEIAVMRHEVPLPLETLHESRMTIVIVAFRDDPGRAVAYKKFTDIEEAVSFYHGLLEQARFKTGKQKPRIISTRIILP